MSEGTEGRKAGQPDTVLRALCSNLSVGLHAVAQPLAILRASLGSDCSGQMDPEELRQLADSSAVEVERVCAMFSCMQQLVNLASAKAQLAETAILPLMKDAVEGARPMFEEDGMALRSSLPESSDAVLIDKRRTAQALSNILLTAHSVSRRSDVVELKATSTADAVSILVWTSSSCPDGITAEWSLNMAVAEANLRSQEAGFRWSPSPFRVQIDFRKASAGNYC